MGPESSHKCPCEREAEGDLTAEEEEVCQGSDGVTTPDVGTSPDDTS